jgi:membrane-bound lytic murein transglycosylase D
MEKILKEKNVPTDLKYVALVESGFALRAKSPADAVGPWQFRASTAKKYGLKVNNDVDQRLDPIDATRAAAWYFSDLYKVFDKWLLALAGYNAGEGRIRKALKGQGYSDQNLLSLSILPLANETQIYPFLIMAFKEIYENPAKFNFPDSLPKYLGTFEFDEVTVKAKKKSLTFSEVASVCGVTVQEIRDLNPSFLKDKIPAGQWTIRLPISKRKLFLSKFSEFII